MSRSQQDIPDPSDEEEADGPQEPEFRRIFPDYEEIRDERGIIARIVRSSKPASEESTDSTAEHS